MKSEWQQRNAARCSCRGSDEYCPCQNDEHLYDRETQRFRAAELALMGERWTAEQAAKLHRLIDIGAAIPPKEPSK